MDPPVLGKEWVTLDMWVVFCRPFPFSSTTDSPLISVFWGWAALGLWGLKRRGAWNGLELAALMAGPRLASPPRAARAAYPVGSILLSVSVFIASKAENGPH